MKLEIPSEIDFTDIINYIDVHSNDTLVVFSDINKLALHYRQKGGFNVREFIDSIQEDVRWLGFNWGKNLFYTSDYFEQLYNLEIIPSAAVF